MSEHTEKAETAINAANQNLATGNTETAQIVATVAVAEAVLALQAEVKRIVTRMP